MRKALNVAVAVGLAMGLAGAPVMASQAPPVSQSSSTAALATMTAPAALDANPQLTARIEPFLPNGMAVQKAAAGFGDVLTFLAAVHVAHNEQLSFSTLKTHLMTGGAKTLVQAVQAVAPKLPPVVAEEAVQMAQHQAQLDIGAAAVSGQGR